jgi:hypothetical protein
MKRVPLEQGMPNECAKHYTRDNETWNEVSEVYLGILDGELKGRARTV